MKAEGARELSRALRAAPRELRLELTRQIKPAVQLVARAAKANALTQGFGPPGTSGRGKGELLRGIKPSVVRGIGYVRETATRDGFRYPAVFEFRKVDKRAFLIPAVEQNRSKVELILGGAVDRALAKTNLK